MQKQTKQEKQIDKTVDRLYKAGCANVQINVFDISKVFTVGRQALAAGDDEATVQAKIVAFVETIRQN